MRAVVCFMISFLVASVVLPAQETTFIEIADSATFIPLSSRLVDFDAPALSGGVVAFCGAGVEQGYEGIFHSNARSFTKLADTDTDVPGGGGVKFRGLRSFFFDGCPSFSSLRGAFLGRAAGISGIYWGFGGPDPIKLAATGDRLPGDEAGFATFSRPSIDFNLETQSGQVVFKALADGFIPPFQPALFSYGIGTSQSTEVILENGSPFPGRPGEFFVTFSDPLADSGRIAFRGQGTEGSTGIFLYSKAAGVSAVAVNGTPIPEGSGGFTGFGSLFVDNVFSTSGGNVAFRGDGDGGQRGVYALIGGALEKIVDLNTPIPGGSGNFTILFNERPSIDGANVAFYGGTAAKTGIYARIDGQLRQVIAVGQRLDEKLVAGVTIGPQALEGSFLAFRAHFNDGSIGVYLAAFEVGDVLAGDLNGDGIVDFRDVGAVQRAFGPCPPFAGQFVPPTHCPEDQNGDGVVDNQDVLEVYARRGFAGADYDHIQTARDLGGDQSVIVPFTTERATTSLHPIPPAEGGPSVSFGGLDCNEGAGLDFHNDIWFRYQVPATCEIIRASTCATNFDTRLAVYAATETPDLFLQAISCNDDTAGCGGGSGSDVSFLDFYLRSTPPGAANPTIFAADVTEVFIRVGSRDESLRGTGTLQVGCATTDSRGDSPQNPFPLGTILRQDVLVPHTYYLEFGDNWPAGVVDVTPDCGEGDLAAGWWGFVAPCTGVIEATAALHYVTISLPGDVSLAVFESSGNTFYACNAAPLFVSGSLLARSREVSTLWGAVTGNLYLFRLGFPNEVVNRPSLVGAADTEFRIECTGNTSCGLPSTGPCDEARPGIPGCVDGTCCTRVCQEDFYCCNIGWDASCTGRALELCSQPGGSP